MGLILGLLDGAAETDGRCVGIAETDGMNEGDTLGLLVGLVDNDGMNEGVPLGLLDGLDDIDGKDEVDKLGLLVGLDDIDGTTVGDPLGLLVWLGDTDGPSLGVRSRIGLVSCTISAFLLTCVLSVACLAHALAFPNFWIRSRISYAPSPPPEEGHTMIHALLVDGGLTSLIQQQNNRPTSFFTATVITRSTANPTSCSTATGLAFSGGEESGPDTKLTHLVHRSEEFVQEFGVIRGEDVCIPIKVRMGGSVQGRKSENNVRVQLINFVGRISEPIRENISEGIVVVCEGSSIVRRNCVRQEVMVSIIKDGANWTAINEVHEITMTIWAGEIRDKFIVWIGGNLPYSQGVASSRPLSTHYDK